MVVDIFSSALASSYCANVTIIMNNSLFATGEATSPGGGVAVVGPYGDFHSTSCDLHSMNGNYIYISNTQFVGNYAQSVGGAGALLGCLGAELKIDETEFF